MRHLLPILLCLSTLLANAQTLELVSRQYVYAPGPFPSCHAATITETTNGNLLAAFFGGTYEGHPDCCIWLSRFDGKKWSDPEMVADGVIDGKKTACYNPVLYQIPNGDLILFYKVGENVQAWRGFLKRSKDGGRTWSAPEQLPDGYLGPVKNKPLMLDDRLICGSSLECGGWRIHIEYTNPSCTEWTKTEDLNDKESSIQIIQPTLFRDLTNNRLTIYCRSRSAGEPIMTSFSDDGGTTWSPVSPTPLPSNNSGIDGVTLNDGTHLLIYNHPDSSNHSARTPLVAAVSRDLIIWTDILTLEDAPVSEFSYPSVIQDSKGLIHIVYTVRRTHIAHVILKSKENPNHRGQTPKARRMSAESQNECR